MALESRAAIATSTATTSTPSLTSSFLPKCTHFLQTKLAHCSLSRASFQGVVASTKQKKKKSSSSAREWSYEHFMVLWDEVFENCCTDSVKATQIRNLASKGLAKHGRGCVLVFQEVQTRPRGSGTGFTSKPPKTSRSVPDFVTLEYNAVYLPREFLLDPRKAPLEEDMAVPDDKEQPDYNAPCVVVEKQEDTAEGEHNDSERGTDNSGDKVIDIEDIIRDAQDVYQFYSDDEDELDATTADDGETGSTDSLTLDGSDDEGNDVSLRASDRDDSLLILNGKDGDSTPDSNSLHTLDDDNYTTHVNASELSDKCEGPLLIVDDREEIGPHATTRSRETQHEDHFIANGDPIVADGSAEAELNCNNSMFSTSIDTEEEQIGDLHSDVESGSTPRLREPTSLHDDANAAQNASGINEASGQAAELLEEGNKITEVQVEGNGGTHAARNVLGSVGTSVVSTVKLLDESFEADTSDSCGLVVVNEKGGQYQGNKSEDVEVELATQQMLYASMRGMDRTRLLSLTANFDFEAERVRYGRRMAVIDVKTVDAGGEDPYNPKEDELVMLLHLRIDGKPAYGADVVVAYEDESHSEENSWKLRGKYRNVFSK